MSLGFDSIAESPISALPSADTSISGVVACGQGSQSADAVAKLAFSAQTTAGQGSQEANASALLQFLAAAESGQGSQSADAVGVCDIVGDAISAQGSQTNDAAALLQFIATATSGQGGQTASALGVSGNGIIAVCESGQGGQVAGCEANAAEGFTALDGVGVGRGNRSWWHDKEIVVDHRIRHKGEAKSSQCAQGAEATGGVRNPFTVVAVSSAQAVQAALAQGDVTDPELEEFAMMAAMMLDEEWREAA